MSRLSTTTSATSPSRPPAIPAWLYPFDRDKLSAALHVLAEREYKREFARSATRHEREGRAARLRAAMNANGSGYGGPHVPQEHRAHFSVEVGSRHENRYENRYYQLEAFDRTRVEVEGRYLNANWVRELYGGRWWIATQAPLPNTAYNFLSLFLQPDTRPPPALAPPDSFPGGPRPCRLRTAVQLTLHHEQGRPKAHPYFPDEIGKSYVVPPPGDAHPSSAAALKITLETQERVREASCIRSTLRLVRCEVPRVETDSPLYTQSAELGGAVRFTHLLFEDWPDFGVPEGPEEKARLLTFARLVASVNLSPPPSSPRRTPNDDEPTHPEPPITVNCSAGVGRTGSFIALCSLLRSHGLLIPEYRPCRPKDFPPLPPSPLGPLPPEAADDEAVAEIDSLREQRPSMVQRNEQQLLVYELLLAAFHERDERSQQV